MLQHIINTERPEFKQMDSNYSIKGSSKGRGKLIVDQYDSISFMKSNQKQQQFICGFCNQVILNRFMISHKKVCLEADKNQYMIDRNQLSKQNQIIRSRNRKLSNHHQHQAIKKPQHNILLGKSNSQKNHIKSQKRKTQPKKQQSFRGMHGTLSSVDAPKIIDRRNRQSQSKHRKNKKSDFFNSVKAQQNAVKRSSQFKNSKRQSSKQKRILSVNKKQESNNYSTKKREQSIKNIKDTKNRNIYDTFMNKSNIHENNSNLKKKSNAIRRNRRNFTHNPIVKNQNTAKNIHEQVQQQKRQVRKKTNHVEPQNMKRSNIISQNRGVRKNRQYTANSRNENNSNVLRREQQQQQNYNSNNNYNNRGKTNNFNSDARNRRSDQRNNYRQQSHYSESIQSQQSAYEEQQYEQWGANQATMNFISDTLNQQFSMLNSQFSMMNQIFSNFNNFIPQGQTQYYFQNQNGNFMFRHNANFEQQNDSDGNYAGQQQEQGLDEQQIQQIPKRRFNERLDNQQQCTVCIGQIKNKQMIKILPCIHMFHVDCIDEWLRRKAKCPVCRQKVCFE